jgi:Protein of unknown function (DUF4242)
MPLFMYHHNRVEGLTADAVADAHRKDVEVQGEYGVAYHRYWFNEYTGEVFCLVEAPDKEAAEVEEGQPIRTHRQRPGPGIAVPGIFVPQP